MPTFPPALHIALLSETYPPDVGGLAVSAARLATGLAAAGHAVEVFAPGASGPPETTGGVLVHRVGQRPRADEALAAWFDHVVARHRARPFDLLHGYYVARAGFVAVYAGHYLGRPALVSARGNDLDRQVFDPARASHALYALQHAAAVTANTRDLARKAAALAPGRQVALLPNGVDAAHFAPVPPDAAHAARLGLPLWPALGFVGEARAKKGLATLLLAFRALAARRAVSLLFVGGVRAGADRDTLGLFRRQHPALPLFVVEHQPPAALPSYYNLLDAVLLPSLADGLPNALLEAMACARPIIGARAGGIPDALRDGENGLLVPPGDPAALASAAERLLDDPALATRLGQQARQDVLRSYGTDRELSAYLELYAQVLGTHHRDAAEADLLT